MDVGSVGTGSLRAHLESLPASTANGVVSIMNGARGRVEGGAAGSVRTMAAPSASPGGAGPAIGSPPGLGNFVDVQA